MFSKTDIEKYFMAEKSGALFLLVIGVLSLIAALVFFFGLKTNWYKGMAVSLLLIGLLEGIVGYTVYKRSDDDRKRMVYAYDMAPQDLKQKELPRIQKVNKTFSTLLWAEVLMLLAGAALFFYFRQQENKQFWSGLGLALAIQAVIALGFDYLASVRAKTYTQGLESFVEKTG